MRGSVRGARCHGRGRASSSPGNNSHGHAPMRHTLFAALTAGSLLVVFQVPTHANPPQQCSFGMGCGGKCMMLFSKLHQHGPLFNYGPYYGYPPFEPYGPWNAYLQYNPWYYGNPYANAGNGGNGNGNGLGGLFHRLQNRDGCGFGHGGCHANWLQGGWFRGNNCLSCGHGWLKSHFGGCHSCGHTSLLKGHSTGCNSCGHTGHGLKTGHIFKHNSGGCSSGSCSTPTLDPATTDAISRYTGAGDANEFAVFYNGMPTLNPVITAGAR